MTENVQKRPLPGAGQLDGVANCRVRGFFVEQGCSISVSISARVIPLLDDRCFCRTR